jgi:hypothetical protein
MLQPQRRAAYRIRAPHAVVELTRREMRFGDVHGRAGIRDLPDAGDLVWVRLRDEQHFVPVIAYQVPDDMEELSRVVLMDEKELHPGYPMSSPAQAGVAHIEFSRLSNPGRSAP